ncbi:MAG: DUF4202 family protein [Candidatus Margulisiibacteriota bacterium]
MKYFAKAKQFVDGAFLKMGDDHNLRHFERTVYWLKQLKPDADEAFLIAAYAHDVERAFRGDDVRQMLNNPGRKFNDLEYMSLHSRKGAEIIGQFLKEQGAGPELIERVKDLISKHEVGGTNDQNLLKDVDSLSFLENNIKHFTTKKVAEHGVDKVRVKFDWMFNRITSEKAKEIARPWYEKAMEELDKSKQ